MNQVIDKFLSYEVINNGLVGIGILTLLIAIIAYVLLFNANMARQRISNQ